MDGKGRVTAIPVWLLGFVALVGIGIWKFRGQVDDEKIEALKAQIAHRDDLVAFAERQREALTASLAATEARAVKLEEQAEAQDWRQVAQTVEALRLEVRSATTANTALTPYADALMALARPANDPRVPFASAPFSPSKDAPGLFGLPPSKTLKGKEVRIPGLSFIDPGSD